MSVKVEYEVKVAEAARAGRAAAQKYGVNGPLVILGSMAAGAALGWAGMFLAGLISDALSITGAARDALGIAAFAIVVLAALGLMRRILNLLYRRQLSRRGTPGPFPASFELAEDHFRYVIGGITVTTRWDVVSELFKAPGWWVFLAQGNSYYVPAKAFSTPGAEQKFVSQALQHLDAAARQRSQKAAAFAAGEG